LGVSLRRILLLLFGLFLVGSTASAQTISGVVTNKTNNKPAAGDDVVLLKLAQGMQELARAKTDSRGHFTIKVPPEEAGSLHLVRVTHDRANYFSPVPANATSVNVDVYTGATQVDGITVSEDVLQVQTTPDGSSLRVVEHFLIENASQPATTLFNEHPFELYLPAGAQVEGGSAKSPGGMAVEQPVVPMGDPNHYTIIFPIRPGETEFAIFYKLPYKDSFSFTPRLTLPTDTLGIVLPVSMNFKQAAGTPYSPVPADQLGGKENAFVANKVNPSQPLGFTVSGKGELPRPGSVQTAANGTPGQTDGNVDPNADTRPGGGLGTPLDKDAERDPWTKYRWWIILGLAVVLAAAAAFMMRTPGAPTAQLASGGTPANALQVLRDEMFAVETDRLEGRLSETDYAQLKAAYDIVLRRALARNGPRGAREDDGKVEIVPE
jgi:hypothetical protein